jgi:predicted acetyltransferase
VAIRQVYAEADVKSRGYDSIIIRFLNRNLIDPLHQKSDRRIQELFIVAPLATGGVARTFCGAAPLFGHKKMRIGASKLMYAFNVHTCECVA